jgi:hypothetical protein
VEGGSDSHPKRQLTSSGQRYVISQKINRTDMYWRTKKLVDNQGIELFITEELERTLP